MPKQPEPFGKYVLIERIAAGGMAEVFRAVLHGAAGFAKPVAVKRILPAFGEEPDFVTLFQDEARIASTLGHANIVQVFDFGEVDGVFYLALELVDGLDLAKLGQRLKALAQPMPLAAAAFIAAETARGLAYAHRARAGLVHRDVSPANILLSRAGDVKIADFGIAKAAGKVHKTEAGVLMGKLRYMSPEQVASDPLDGRSDLFSLGVVLYELVTGGPIFPGDPGVKLAELIRTAPIEPPSARNPAVPPALDAIVGRALARDRDERYATGEEMARDLAGYLAQEAPGFSREDLGALVRAASPETPQAESFLPTVASADAAPTPSLRRPAREPLAPSPAPRRRSTALWVALASLILLVGSGTLLLLRFALPGGEQAPDAAPPRAVVSAADAALEAAPDDAPFTLLATATPEERRTLVADVDGRMVTRRGVATPDYLAFLSAVDAKLAALTVEGDGRAEAPGVLPPAIEAEVARAGVRDAVEAVGRYLRATGELPPLVKSAARAFLAGRPSVSAEGAMGTAPYAAPALAVWLEPGNRKRLVELAYANDLLWRWCEPPEPPRRHFAPVLCERTALVTALRAGDADDKVAAALERWVAAQPSSDTTVIRAIYRPAARPSAYEVAVTVRETGDGALSFRLLAAGVDGPVVAAAADVSSTALFFEVPRRIFAPVLGIRDGADAEVYVRLQPPPWGGAQ